MCGDIFIWSLQKALFGQIWTNLRPANLGQLCHQNPIFWVLGRFQRPRTGVKHNYSEKQKICAGIIFWSPQKTLLGQIWTNPWPSNLRELLDQNHLFRAQKMAKNYFSRQYDLRYINLPSKWTYKPKIMMSFVRRTDILKMRSSVISGAGSGQKMQFFRFSAKIWRKEAGKWLISKVWGLKLITPQ